MKHHFLLSPHRLNQAIESSVSGGGGSFGNAITRRSFLKRTGGATVAAMVAWNTSTHVASAQDEPTQNPSSDSLKLYCQDEPAANSYSNACPSSLQGAQRQQLPIGQLDSYGEAVIWMLAHWLELHSYPKRKDGRSLGGELSGQVTAHVAVVRGQWTYAQNGWDPVRQRYIDRNTGQLTGQGYGKDTYVWTTECHLTAGGGTAADEKFKVTTTGPDSSPSLVFNDISDYSNKHGAFPISWGGQILGWAMISLNVVNFKLASYAIFVPRSYLTSTTTSSQWDVNVDLGVDLKKWTVGGGGSYGQSWSSTYGINQEPPNSPILLDWTFVIRQNPDSIEDPTVWTKPSPGVQLP